MEKLIVYNNYEKLRNENHMTDYYVSKITGLNRANFTAWRKGVNPSRASIERLAKFFKKPINYFYNEQA